jgi:UDP-N-acetylmuramoyl-L-alanyl-D-glutamate--2,6-diaminopimelate ligase
MLLSQLMQPGDDLPQEWADLDIAGLTADSREVEPGFLFAALPGTVMDGAKFVPQALKKGAVAILAPPGANLDLPDGTALVSAQNPRRMLAHYAAKFYGAQPEICVAVTGTNGKTSVVSFVRQIWQALGHRAASLGTVGFVTPEGSQPLVHTTPDPVALHQMLRQLEIQGVDHLAAEVSSHGLAQYRADGVRLAAAAFTNISRDHLDYHDSFEDYFAQKLRLFSELLQPGAAAVINADSPDGRRVVEICEARGLTLWTVGENGAQIKLAGHTHSSLGHDVRIRYGDEEFDIHVPLVGDFQVSNALVAAGLALATGSSATPVFRALESLRGAKGRLDLVTRLTNGALVFVDYAHTPDALRNALAALRPFTGERLLVVFGCGGDRDRGKRRLMGEAARDLADVPYVTDDNPRTEDPATIRREALLGCPDAIEIGDRRQAIAAAIGELRERDILVIAGKGHESGQIVGTEKLPFSDHDVVREIVGEGAIDG